MNPAHPTSSYAKMSLAFAVGVALSASYVALGSFDVLGAEPPTVVVVEERCEQPNPSPTPALDEEQGGEGTSATRELLPAYGLDRAELERLARHCEVRDDVPEPLDDATAAALGLSADEREAYEVALARFTGQQAAKEFFFLNTLAPDEVLPVDDPVAFRLMLRQRADASKGPADRSVRRHLAEERAGLRPPTSTAALERASTWARYERFRLSSGDRFAAELAEQLEPARVDALRRVHQGWPGRRLRVSGCEDVSLPTRAKFMVQRGSGQGELEPDIIERIITAHASEIQACYEIGLADDPELAGDLQVRFVIGETGKVRLAEVEDDSTLVDELVHECATQALTRWMFPKPQGGEVRVKYGFTLRPNP